MRTIPIDSLESHVTDLQIWSMSASSRDLGMISPTTQTLNLQLHNSTTVLEISQSISSLKSEVSSTGFVIWRICPIFMDFLAKTFDFKGKFIFELGSGIGGLGPLILGEKCTDGGMFVASDQYHLLKLLKKNITSNLSDVGLSDRITSKSLELEIPKKSSKKGKLVKSKINIEVCCFDWEEIDQGIYNLKELNPIEEYPDFIIGCDIVYNDYLIPYLIESITRLSGPKTKILIGLQLRLLDNIESFVDQLLALDIFKVSTFDEFTPDFKDLENGFVIYYIERK